MTEKTKVLVRMVGNFFDSTVLEVASLRNRLKKTFPDFEFPEDTMKREDKPDIIVDVSWDRIIGRVVYDLHLVSHLSSEDEAVMMIQSTIPFSRRLKIDPEKLFELALELGGDSAPAAMRPQTVVSDSERKL